MTKAMVALALGLFCWSASAQEAKPIPKEGSLLGANYGSSTIKVMPMGKDRMHFTYDFTGIRVGEPGDVFHNASIRCLGAMHIAGGSWDNESASCVYTLPSGDQVFMVHKASGKLGGETRGTTTLIGGTGKMEGIQGSAEWSRTSVRPAAEGTSQSTTRILKGTYKLP